MGVLRVITLWKIRIRAESAWVRLLRKIENRCTLPPVWDRTEDDE